MNTKTINTRGRATPCSECPFARTTPAGMLGGSHPETYIGQAFGPFYLPCHSDYTAEAREGFDKKDMSTRQCAGAAMFRANVGVEKVMPNGIHKLPEDRDKVFATPGEFLSHHMGHGTPSEWNASLTLTAMLTLVGREMDRAGAKG